MNRAEHGAARAGRLTSTMAKRLMSGNYRAWNTLLDEIRNPRPFYDLGPNTPAPLRWGLEHETQAAGVFWLKHPELEVHNPRFLTYHSPADVLRAKWVAASPDRMLSPAGQVAYHAGLELKCPFQQEKHYSWSATGGVPDEHIDQCYFGMLTAGLTRWCFGSYDPRADDFYEYWLAADLTRLAELAGKVDRFLEVLDAGEVFTPPPTSTAGQFRQLFGGGSHGKRH